MHEGMDLLTPLLFQPRQSDSTLLFLRNYCKQYKASDSQLLHHSTTKMLVTIPETLVDPAKSTGRELGCHALHAKSYRIGMTSCFQIAKVGVTVCNQNFSFLAHRVGASAQNSRVTGIASLKSDESVQGAVNLGKSRLR